MAEQRDDHIIDVDRFARPEGPRVVGAQWDELRGVWERWDDEAQAWIVVGEGTIVSEPEMDAQVAMAETGATAVIDDDDEGHIGGNRIIDLDRAPRPGGPPVPGAQWNEVVGRWEIWSDAAGRWVDAPRAASR